jgi:hypothetical protein
MSRVAVLFGLNYSNDESLKLRGCINDVKNMSEVLQKKWGFKTDVYTDDESPEKTTGMGMVRALYELAIRSWRENLRTVWIHYSGHGSYMKDRSGDERDGYDECLVPSDVRQSGLIPDDFLHRLFRFFNPNTKVVCVFDCCHSGTMVDLPYYWDSRGRVTLENRRNNIRANVLTISGCLDNQTSADAYSVANRGQYEGAMSGCMQMVLNRHRHKIDVFRMLQEVRNELRKRGFPQYPKVASTYNLRTMPYLV